MKSTLQELCRGIKASAVHTDRRAPWGDDDPSMDGWSVTLKRDGRQLTVPFWKGLGHDGTQPTVVQVMECLLSDSCEIHQGVDFEEWASNLGYDLELDRRKAKATFAACERVYRRLQTFLGDGFEMFLYADNTER